MKGDSSQLSACYKIIFCLALSALLFALGVPAQAKDQIPRIGILFIGGRNQPHLESFKRGLKERGYTEGKNILLDYRYAEGKYDRLPELAAEFVREKVDIIVTTSSLGARAARQTTKTIPIVLTTGDPVGSGLATSLAKPGGNVTGLTVLLADLSGKRLEILKETLPKMTRIAALWSSQERDSGRGYKETEQAARAFSLRLHPLEVRTAQDFEPAFVEMAKNHDNGLVVILSQLVTLHSRKLWSWHSSTECPVCIRRDNSSKKAVSSLTGL
jgi:ABC-type uncharacterized transport system substrate-binding protein